MIIHHALSCGVSAKPHGTGPRYLGVQSTPVVRMGNLPKGTLASCPPWSILGHLRWPCPARKAS
eukprot:8891239-Pyramimonas_sp.AAC.1